MFIILTTNYAEATPPSIGEELSTRIDGKSYYPGQIIYRTADEAFAQIRKLIGRYRKAKEATRLLKESGAFMLMGPNLDELPEPEFAVFELREVSQINVSALPKLDLGRDDRAS